MAEPTAYQIANDVLRIAIPAAIVVIGWWIVSNQNDKRERRKEIRSIVDELKEIILEIRADTIEYYSERNSEATGSLSDKIKLNFLLVSQYLLLLRNAGMAINVSAELIALRKTATGGYFENAQFRKQGENPKWLSGLCSESVELILAIEKAYFRSFPVKL
jgi:hypothetical protein